MLQSSLSLRQANNKECYSGTGKKKSKIKTQAVVKQTERVRAGKMAIRACKSVAPDKGKLVGADEYSVKQVGQERSAFAEIRNSKALVSPYSPYTFLHYGRAGLFPFPFFDAFFDEGPEVSSSASLSDSVFRFRLANSSQSNGRDSDTSGPTAGAVTVKPAKASAVVTAGSSREGL